MTSLCPRCGTPRLAVFCSKCGFDFRAVDAQMAPPPPPPPVYQAPAAPAPPLYGATGPQPFPPPPPPIYEAPPPPPVPAEVPPPPPPTPAAPPPPAPEPAAAPIGAYQEPAPPPFGQPAYQPVGQPPAAPSVCPRCYAPLYPGSTRCGSCGYETGSPWAMAPAAPRSSALPIALALLGIGCLVLAAAVFVVAQSGGSSATASPSSIAAATATPTAEPTPTPTPTATPTAAGTLGPGGATPEPTAPFKWTTFSSPDGKWSAKFPGTAAPTKTTGTTGSGAYQATTTLYSVMYGGAQYEVGFADYSASALSGVDQATFLDQMVLEMTSMEDATDVVWASSTVGGHPARDVALTSNGERIAMRVFLVGSRFYILAVGARVTAPIYPQYFFAEFQLA